MVSLGIAWVVNRYTNPVYQVTASLFIKENETGRAFSGLESVIPGMEILRTQKKIVNEMEVLRSYKINSRAIDSLDFGISYVSIGKSGFRISYLYHNCPFIVIPDTTKVNKTGVQIRFEAIDQYTCRIFNDELMIDQKIRYGEKFQSKYFNFTIEQRKGNSIQKLGEGTRNYFILHSKGSLVNEYKSKLQIKLNDDKRGSVMFLSLNGMNPEQDVNYLNTLIEVYIDDGLREKNATAVNTVKFIDGQLGVLTDSLKGAEEKLQNFRLTNRLFNLSQEGQLVYSRLDRYSQNKSLLELKLRYFEYLRDYVKNKINLNEPVTPSILEVSDPLLTGMINQLSNLLAEKDELDFSVKSTSPQSELVNAKIEAVRQNLIENIENLVYNTKISIQETSRQIVKVEKDLDKLPITEKELIQYQREYKVNDQIYTFLLQKRAEAAIASASSVSDNKPLDEARVENAIQISPRTKLNYMLGLAFGIMIPLVVLLLLEALNTKISDRSEIEKRTNVPIIGTVGHYLGENEIPVNENPRSSLSESFRALRTNLQYLLHEKDKKVIAITSTITGEGKTFTSINLAAIHALAGKKTLLIGLDLRKPKIWRTFGLDNKTGISTFLIGKNQFEEVIHPTFIPNLYVSTAGPIPPNPAELIGSASMIDFVNKSRDEFDIVVIDTPPFGLVIDSVIIGRLADVNLFMVRQKYSVRDVLDAIDELYIKNELPKIGIVLNDVSPSGYYYKRGYRYYNYGYGYGMYTGNGYYSDDELPSLSLKEKIRKFLHI
jgi:capsular exopolysaccharide synthesis family protein